MRQTAILCSLLLAASPAAADATLTLADHSWEMHDGSPGTVSLTVGSRTVVPTQKAGVKLPASKQLVKATLAIGDKRRDEIWIELRDGHRYSIVPDPCCFLSIFDRDDGLDKAPRCGAPCPPGTIEVDKWSQHGHNCGARPTCAPPALLRIRGNGVTATWDGEPVAADGAYHSVAVARESPHYLLARQDDKPLWEAVVVVRHGGRYTLDLIDPTSPRILVDGPAK